ncbi:hypothetical protein BGZ68_002509 [Mortierella alpina]|nr:hypothetical protein BGZ68_002509 [Mortierella alpina]
MAEKLQEKFALVQQMKREKELKEARAKESQPFDIFSIAGVNLPSSGNSGGLNMTIRHDSQGSGAPSVGSVKRPRKERTQSSSSDTGHVVPSTGAAVVDEESTGQRTKLKRSSMAARNSFQDTAISADITEHARPSTDTSNASGLIDQTSETSSTTDTTGSDNLENTLTATPLTPIASPKTDVGSRRNSGSTSPTKMLAKDMTHNVQSRSGSVDENEEMVIDMFGRSVPRSRHHSSDEGSDSENESAYRRSRSRSVSPYYPHIRDGADRRRRGGGRRGGDRDGRDRLSGDEMASGPAGEVDPYQAASRYLDTAFYPTKIYVGNLPSSISLTSLRTLFAPFGDIEDMNLVEGKDFGFVTYVEPIGAQQALAKMNGAMIDGTFIRVNRAKIPERNRRGFAGVAWMDEDGELARLEEEQHQQAAAISGGFIVAGAPSSSAPASASSSRSESSSSSHHLPREEYHSRGGGMATLEKSGMSAGSSRTHSPTPVRPTHQLPARPRSPKLPPKPTGAASFPPAGMDPRASMTSGRGGARQILRYDDL